jgi:HAD superfamily hydrolase (TIGR01509 family)
MPSTIDWSKIRSVIFDVDGTLYDKRILRRFMFGELCRHALGGPAHWKDLGVIMAFRKQRIRHREDEVERLEESQYEWAARRCRVPPEAVRDIVTEWMLVRPLRYLPRCKYNHLDEFLRALEARGVATAVFSDYPAVQKLSALGLSVAHAVCATDSSVNRLKPNPRGLQFVAKLLDVPPEECVYIGDEEDLDAECARNAGMQFLIIGNKKRNRVGYFKDYLELTNQVARTSTINQMSLRSLS